MGSLIFDLKTKLLEKNYQLTTLTFNCFWFHGFNYKNTKTGKIDQVCNDSNFSRIKDILSNERNSIIIFGGRFPLYLSKEYFNNEEGGIESRNLFGYDLIPTQSYENIQESFTNDVLHLSKENKIIIIYPIPEVGWNPNKNIYLQWIKNKNIEVEPITTSYEVYKKRTMSSFMFLDGIKNENVYRIYPHELFCNTKSDNRCITHNKKTSFYYDDDHLSLDGSKIVNNLIINKIENIE